MSGYNYQIYTAGSRTMVKAMIQAQQLQATAQTANDLDVIVSWEAITDVA